MYIYKVILDEKQYKKDMVENVFGTGSLRRVQFI